jgi:hypothetical protein
MSSTEADPEAAESTETAPALDPSLIPPGEFCYRIVEIQLGEILSKDAERFGRDLREFRYDSFTKEVLCPYWQRSEYGTIRCEFLGREVVDEDDPDAIEKIAAHFGTSAVPAEIGYNWELADESKICDIRLDEEDT